MFLKAVGLICFQLLLFLNTTAQASENFYPFTGIWLNKQSAIKNLEINAAEIDASGLFYFIAENGKRSKVIGKLKVLSVTQAELLWDTNFIEGQGRPLEKSTLLLNLKNADLELSFKLGDKVQQIIDLRRGSGSELIALAKTIRGENSRDLQITQTLIGKELSLSARLQKNINLLTNTTTVEETRAADLVNSSYEIGSNNILHTPKKLKFIDDKSVLVNDKFKTFYKIVDGHLLIDLRQRSNNQVILESFGKVELPTFNFYGVIKITATEAFIKRGQSLMHQQHQQQVTTYYFFNKTGLLETLRAHIFSSAPLWLSK